jgi:apolipoprotein N-acyltransferase
MRPVSIQYICGQRLADYTKHHLAPGPDIELNTPRHSYSMFEMDGHLFGVAICKDMDFPALSRHYGRAHVAALLVPAWDFDEDGWLHSRMAILRGVEDGFSVIRSGADGLLTVTDPYGRVLAQTRSQPDPGASLTATARICAPIATLYSSVGDLFGYLCVLAITLGIALVLLQPPLRNRAFDAQAEPPPP